MKAYDLGLQPALEILGAAALLTVFVSLAIVFRAKGHTTNLALIAIMSLFIAPICFALLLFPAVYSTCNLVQQDIFSPDFWKGEFSNGVFAIRVSSYVLTAHLAITLVRLRKRHAKLVKTRRERGLNMDDAVSHTIDERPEEAKLWIASDVNFVSVFQFVFYLSCVSVLWLSAISNIHTILTSLSSWCLFFIVDDWTVISDYTNEFETPAMTGHFYKILGFNIVLFGLISLISLTNFEWSIWLPIILVMLFSLFIIYMYSWRARNYSTKSSHGTSQETPSK